MKAKKLIIAGGSGFVGQSIANHFVQNGWEIVILSRFPNNQDAFRMVRWDGQNIGPWTQELEGADMLINLNGKSVDCRYNERNKALIYATRIQSTKVLASALRKVNKPPKLWINAASATIYRHSLDKQMDEHTGEYGTGFSVDVCQKWERAFFESEISGVRKVALRMAIVLGKYGGVLKPFAGLTRMGMGGVQGKGDQYFSWIHELDVNRIIEFIWSNEQVSGVLNAAAPRPERNYELMKHLRTILGVPVGLNLPKWLLEVGAVFMRTETELVLKSRNVVSAKLAEAGFQFKYEQLESALRDLL